MSKQRVQTIYSRKSAMVIQRRVIVGETKQRQGEDDTKDRSQKRGKRVPPSPNNNTTTPDDKPTNGEHRSTSKKKNPAISVSILLSIATRIHSLPHVLTLPRMSPTPLCSRKTDIMLIKGMNVIKKILQAPKPTLIRLRLHRS